MEGINLNDLVDRRALLLGEYIVENNSTVRATAKVFGVSKSTVHKDITRSLMRENPQLCSDVAQILKINKEERHIRGGIATRDKYRSLRENK
jgi:putative DeoR family transcriptional regulator (stage III sporulation protein D)